MDNVAATVRAMRVNDPTPAISAAGSFVTTIARARCVTLASVRDPDFAEKAGIGALRS